MQAQLKVYCEQCGEYLGMVRIDTADMPEELQAKVNAVILAHRPGCRYYGGVNSSGLVERFSLARR